jgi:D-alanyl-D-alanine carboxypeptidase
MDAKKRKSKTRGLVMACGILATGILLPLAAEAGGSRVAPEFSLSPSDLQAMTHDLPPRIRSAIMANQQDFLHLLANAMDEPADLLVLVDKSHTLAAEYEPDDLVSLSASSLTVSSGDPRVRKTIMPAVTDMARAARADGVTLVFSSGYRSFEYQKSVYAREVKTYGQEMADRESARPGASQHQLGTAIDFGSITDAFADTRAGKWLFTHAGDYGFSLSYPQGYEEITGYRYESWHYRYITKPAVVLQRKYFSDVQQYLLLFLYQNRAVLEAKRHKSG